MKILEMGVHTPAAAVVPSSPLAWHLVYEISYAIPTAAQPVCKCRRRNNQGLTFFTALPALLSFSAAAPSSCWGRIRPWTMRSVSRWRCGWGLESPRCRHYASKLPEEAEENKMETVSFYVAFICSFTRRPLTFPGVKVLSPLMEILSSGRILS